MRLFEFFKNGATIFFMPMLFIVRRKRGLVIIFLLFALTGCFQYYYKTNTRNTINAFEVQQLQAANKYFIIHFRDSVVALGNVSVNDNKIEGNMVQLLPAHSKYLDPDRTSVYTQTTRFSPRKHHYRVKAADRNNTFMEVHIYADESIDKSNAQLSLPVSSLKRIDVYELDREATTANHVLSIVGAGLVIGSAAVLIAFAIACNCPQVYVNNNGDCQFISGVYSGAVYSSLERTDYLPLIPLDKDDKTYQLKIKNVKDEEQFINCMLLLQVNHPVGSKVLIDRHGNVLSYEKPVSAVKAIINGHTDVRKQVAIVDEEGYSFDSRKDSNGLSSLELTFDKPRDAKKAKLIVHAGNSNWSGYLYHSFAELFGSGYEKWKAEKDKSDPHEMQKWQTEEGLPLMVYVERKGKWEFVDYFDHTGNTASRNMIMELDVANIAASQVKIKLETVYQFWDLDCAAIDFSTDALTTSTVLNGEKALKGDGTDQTQPLNEVDKNYCYLRPEEELALHYNPSLTQANNTTSFFLMSTGYYHSIKKYQGKPQLSTLLKFKNKNAFDDYSREKFLELQATLDSYSVRKK